jgi:hypothetical protein
MKTYFSNKMVCLFNYILAFWLLYSFYPRQITFWWYFLGFHEAFKGGGTDAFVRNFWDLPNIIAPIQAIIGIAYFSFLSYFVISGKKIFNMTVRRSMNRQYSLLWLHFILWIVFIITLFKQWTLTESEMKGYIYWVFSSLK